MTQNSFVRTEEGTVFPNPNDPREIAWRLKYSAPTKQDLLVAASYMEAYSYLFTVSQSVLLKKVRMVKKAITKEN